MMGANESIKDRGDNRLMLNIEGLIHGGDYNPEQWLERPEILIKDIELMKKAKVNVVTLGVFSWSMLEPTEGVYTFDWMEEIVGRLYDNGIKVFMATPSGARPKWMADRYEEVLRVDEQRVRQLFGGRHNHCYTSPVYREKAKAINHEIARRFSGHPGVVGWHISNELGGDCHCPLCQEAFRNWLKVRYKTIDELNRRWYTTFWSHTYQSFDQIESPSPIGESALHALTLDWQRFVTDQTIDFVKHEASVLRGYNNAIPVTTNFMYYFNGLDYFKFKDVVDFISWDSYPTWHKKDDHIIGLDNGMWHDMMRSIKNMPFILMESTPSYTNWQGVSKPKKPGMHQLASLQAIAHGSDAVMYFQWRQSRGASEKFHGAVVQHDGRDDTRYFKEVSEVGQNLADLPMLQGTHTEAKVAIIYDWENKWAIEASQGPRNKGFSYIEAIQKSYNALKKYGIDVDFIDMDCDMNKYEVVIAPMLYMFRNGIEDKIRQFVECGKTMIMGYWSGIVDENDQCFQGEVPYNLTDVFGVSRQEFVGMYDGEVNKVADGYCCEKFCEVLRGEGAKILYAYKEDYFADTPAVTVNHYGEKNGQAIYIGADFSQEFYNDFYRDVLEGTCIKPIITMSLPDYVHVSSRQSEDARYVFLQNYSNASVKLELGEGDDTIVFASGKDGIQPYGTIILKQRL